jgi:acetolactate synthase I/II/III large subunit
MTLLTGGQALAQSLRTEGVCTIFGLPGVQLDWAFDALYAERETIRVIHPRHEQAAAYMADGYARTTGEIGVFLVVPGPGVLNAASALATAYANNSPVLCVTGQIPSDLIGVGRGVLHEIDDQLGLLRHLTKWAARASTPGDVPYVVHEAFRQLRSGRPRPVAIEIPPDVLAMTGEVRLGEPLPPERLIGDRARLEAAAKLLGEAERPLILVGGGIVAAGASEALQVVAELLEAPVIMSTNGRGALSDRHDLAQTQLALPDLLPTADAVLAVGTRLTTLVGQPIPVGNGRPLVRIDADPTQLNRTVASTIPIAADARLALAELANRIPGHNRRRPARRAESATLRRALDAETDAADPPGEFGRAIRAVLPENGILVGEMTQIDYWARFGHRVYQPRTYVNPGYQGTLGCGFPTALGAKVAHPDRVVISINGDGGFGFNANELATAVQHDIGLITIVFDDGAFGNVRGIQMNDFAGHTIASDLRNPSFARLAEVYGAVGIRAEGANALEAALREAVTRRGPTLIEVPVGPMPYPAFLRRAVAGLTQRPPVSSR